LEVVMLYDAITRQVASADRIEALKRDYLRGRLAAQKANAERIGNDVQRFGRATGAAGLRGHAASLERCPRRVTA
jgi:hypothetical protein